MGHQQPDQALALIRFWFEELRPADWWRKDAQLDALLRERFGALHAQAAAGECWPWRATADGRLAEVLLLDQFSRNLFRDTPQAFAQDGMALALAQEAVAGGHDKALPAERRAFLYMPYMHSESRRVHEEALRLFSHPELAFNLDFERRHLAIIERFGRYPHRNAILGRVSTAEEREFLKQPGSSF
ncbi:MAG: DUF924 domain-containing protein [Burkholderiales bacterium]|nr:DUF924 domain-containing protein [Burkholderiales bacterium]